MWAIVWNRNIAIDIGEWPICGGGRLESFLLNIIYTYAYIYIYIYIYVCVCMYIYICMHIYTPTCIHEYIFMHIQTFRLFVVL